MEEKTLAVLHNDAIAAANAVVSALNEHKGQKELKALKKTCKEAVDMYNDRLSKAYYLSLASDYGPDAVKTALLAEETAIPGVIGISFAATDDDVAYFKETSPVIKISLVQMMKAIGPEYFHEADWFSRVSVLSRLMAVTLNRDLCGSATFQYIIDESAREFKLDDAADPTSTASMVKGFQRVIDGILWVGDSVNKKGEPVNDVKFTSKNWAYVRECMTRQGSKIGQVLYGSPAKCTELVADCIHLILTNKGNTLQVG